MGDFEIKANRATDRLAVLSNTFVLEVERIVGSFVTVQKVLSAEDMRLRFSETLKHNDLALLEDRQRVQNQAKTVALALMEPRIPLST